MQSSPWSNVAPALAFVLACAFVGLAKAQPSPADRALATDLFKQGRTLMGEGKYDEACPKLAESHRLDPGGGTLLNLALCHESQGMTATAWSELNHAISLAQRDGRPDREQLARERAAALEPKLSRLIVAVPADAVVPDLIVRRDGTPVAQVVWGVPMPVDPGEHRVDAEAPGRVAWSATIAIGPNADRQTVTVPLLAVAEPPAEPIPPAPAPVVAPQPAPPPAQPQPPRERPDTSPPSLAPAIVAGGIGVVALGFGTAFGIQALSLKSSYDDDCGQPGGCSIAGATDSADALKAADRSTAAFIVGGVALGTAGALFYWRWRNTPKSAGAGVGMRVGTGGASVAGAF